MEFTIKAEDWNEQYEDYDPEEPIIYCPNCEKRGYMNAIGPKILMPKEPKPDNYSDLWECATCGLQGDIGQIPKEATVKDAVETVESPTDDKLKLVSAHKRRKPTRKVSRHINKHIRKTKDPDIALAIKQVGEDNVKVHYDSNP
jgi:hypothetical protein